MGDRKGDRKQDEGEGDDEELEEMANEYRSALWRLEVASYTYEPRDPAIGT